MRTIAIDKALREKLDGISRREKFRIRYHNGDTSVIHLEKKSKIGGLGNKQCTKKHRVVDDGIFS